MATSTDLSHLRLRVREGDELAVLALADALDENGDSEAAEALRAVPALLDGMRWSMDRWDADGVRVELHYIRLPSTGLWECGLLSGSPVTREAEDAAVGVVLRRWDDLHIAVEYLARRLGLMMVDLSFSELPPGVRSSGPWTGELRPFSLARSHLRALPTNCVINYCVLRHPKS
jgi:hypothetical protein